MASSPRDIELLRSQIEAAAEADGTADQAAMFARMLDDLRTTVETLRVAEEELQAQHDELGRARAAIEAEQRRYRDLFERAPDAYVVTDERGKVVQANAAARRLLNVSQRALVGKALAAYVESQDRFAFQKRVAELVADDEACELQFRVVARSGAPADIAATVAASREADGSWLLRWLLRDVTVRVREEAEVRARTAELERRVRRRTRELSVERDRLRLLFERLHQGVVTFNRDLAVGFANHELREILATPRLRPGDQLPDVWGQTSLRALARQLHGRGAEPLEVVIDDGSRTLLVVGLPALALGEAVLVVTDVTARERRDRAERAFVTNAAHELQTPLTAISSAVEVLQDGAKRDPEQLDRFLGHIDREAARLRRLARALLQLARAQTGVEPPRRDRLDVLPLLRQVAAGVQPVPGVSVRVECPARLRVLANRELMEQAVTNLAGNAAKYTPAGEITLAAARLEDGRVAIEVRDTGRGIDVNDQHRMLERFYRGDLSGVHDWSGFGLGLPIVAETAKTIGAELEIESTPGVGTTARLILPSRRGEAA